MKPNTNRDKSKKRAAILEGAIEVFIEMGYELASMDRIADTAGVSKRTVYNHFGSKENLFEAILSDHLAQRQSLKTILFNREEPLESQLLAFAHAEIFLIDTPKRLGLSRLLTKVFLNDLSYARETVAKYPPPYAMLLDWLAEAERAGRIHTDDPMLAATMFYAMIEGAITWPALFSEGINKSAFEPILNEMIALFLTRYGNDE